MKIILINNYKPDNQESMRRFTEMLRDNFASYGIEVKVTEPVIILGHLAKSTIYGYGKWLGYIDKWVLYPILLLLKSLFSGSNTHFHICDHSNAIYRNYLPNKRLSITCHDVLAIRAAFGDTSVHGNTTRFGKILQKWISGNLVKINKIACVSNFTLNQLIELNNGVKKENWIVIHNGFNAEFKPLPENNWKTVLLKHNQQALVDKEYILHVGSGLPRKNRLLLLKMAKALGTAWDGVIVFAGERMNDELIIYAAQKGLTERVVEIVKPQHGYLEALFSGARAFIFPSFSEGFGWPVTEAQACGTPVIASDIAPMPEVGGEGALYANPYKAEEFAQKFMQLKVPEFNDQLIQLGFKNVERFETQMMIKKYIEFLKDQK